MSIKDVSSLNSVHIDVLKEVGNIGQGNAASALASMMGKPIDISVPDVKTLSFGETVEFLGGPEEPAIGMMIGLKGDINGMMLYVLNREFANKLLNDMLGKKVDDLWQLDEMDMSFVKEIGNILSGSYINAIAQLTGLTIDITIPYVTIDMVGAILSVPAVEFAQTTNKVLFIDDSFIVGEGAVTSNMILIPETDSLELLFTKLGVEI